jgi:hypothetical protein
MLTVTQNQESSAGSCFWISTILTCLMAAPLHSQERPAAAAGDRSDAEITRFETGVQTTDLRTGCVGKRDCNLPSAAAGVSGTLNLNPHFAIDANWIVTPSVSTGSDNFSGGRATQFLAGVREEVRSKHWGLFLAAQPGVLHWNHVITAVDTTSPTLPFSDMEVLIDSSAPWEPGLSILLQRESTFVEA